MSLICPHGVDLEKREPPFCQHCSKCIWCDPKIATPALKPEDCDCKGTRIGSKLVAISFQKRDLDMLKSFGFDTGDKQ